MEPVDLRILLQSWPFDGESSARVAHGFDGREIILVRQPMGLEQYELQGRPDGLRPHGMESALEFQRSRFESGKSSASAQPFKLTAEECAELFHEGTLYYHRFAHLFRIEDWARAERDAARNLDLIDFVKCHAEHEEDRRRAEQWHPDITRMHVIATGMNLLEKNQHEEFQTLRPRHSGIHAANIPPHGHAQFGTRNSDGSLAHPPSIHASDESAFLRHGDYWTIIYQQHLARLKTTRGLHCLANLLRHPGSEFHVGQLIERTGDKPVAARILNSPTEWQDGHLSDPGPILDRQAKVEYKARLVELRQELEEAERFNDFHHATRVRNEMSAIAKHLSSAIGLGGRDRKSGFEAERARSAVTKRIKISIHKIAEVIPPLGHHLSARIKTGYFCSYNPHPDRPVAWRF